MVDSIYKRNKFSQDLVRDSHYANIEQDGTPVDALISSSETSIAPATVTVVSVTRRERPSISRLSYLTMNPNTQRVCPTTYHTYALTPLA